jgi:hypothetical protein
MGINSLLQGSGVSLVAIPAAGITATTSEQETLF